MSIILHGKNVLYLLTPKVKLSTLLHQWALEQEKQLQILSNRIINITNNSRTNNIYFHSMLTNTIFLSFFILTFVISGADPGFDEGRAQIMTGLNCQWCAAASCEQSEPFLVWGPGPALGPQKLLGISLLNMHSLHFGVPFYTIFEIIKY